MPIEKPEQIDDGCHGFGLSTLVTRKGVLSAAGELRSLLLGQFQLPANARQLSNFLRVDLIAERDPRSFFLCIMLGEPVMAVVAERTAGRVLIDLAAVLQPLLAFAIILFSSVGDSEIAAN